VRPVKVLNVINDLSGDGGAEVALATTLRNLGANRVEAWVGIVFGSGRNELQVGIPAERVVNLGFRRRAYADPIAFERLRRFLVRERFDVVHAQLFDASLVGRIAALVARIPATVVTVQNSPPERKAWCVRADQILAKRTTQMVAISHAVARHAADELGVPEDRFRIIPNGVEPVDTVPNDSDEVRALRRELRLRPEQVILLAVGSLAEQKGHSVLLGAMPHVVARHPDVVLLLAGKGRLQGSLEDQARSLRIDDRVRFLGSRSDVPQLLGIADIFVMPSLWEGLGVALLEAAVHGVPAVASRVDGIVEIIEDGASGVLVEPSDPADLVRGLEVLLGSETLRSRMGCLARERVHDRYGAARVAGLLTELYEELAPQAGSDTAARVGPVGAASAVGSDHSAS